MPAQAFVERLNEQIGNEFSASQQYVAMAVYYDAQTLPQLAGFFYRQAVEERNHAMIMVQYLLDVGAEPQIPGSRRRAASSPTPSSPSSWRWSRRSGCPSRSTS